MALLKVYLKILQETGKERGGVTRSKGTQAGSPLQSLDHGSHALPTELNSLNYTMNYMWCLKEQKHYNLSLKHCRTDELSFQITADVNMASFNEICAEAAAMLVSLTYVEQYDVSQWAV